MKKTVRRNKKRTKRNEDTLGKIKKNIRWIIKNEIRYKYKKGNKSRYDTGKQK